MKWEKVGTEILASGEKTITYATSALPHITIESRRRNIPHSDRSGSWQHTSYFVIDHQSGEEKEYCTLSRAKEAAS